MFSGCKGGGGSLGGVSGSGSQSQFSMDGGEGYLLESEFFPQSGIFSGGESGGIETGSSIVSTYEDSESSYESQLNPEPSTILMLTLSLLGLLGCRINKSIKGGRRR